MVLGEGSQAKVRGRFARRCAAVEPCSLGLAYHLEAGVHFAGAAAAKFVGLGFETSWHRLSTIACSRCWCQVYRGKLGHEPAAIKMLRCNQLSSNERERFLLEAAILKNCRWVGGWVGALPNW